MPKARLLGLWIGITGLLSCGSLRFHDEASLKRATEATQLSGQIREGVAKGFDEVESALDETIQARDRVQALKDTTAALAGVRALPMKLPSDVRLAVNRALRLQVDVDGEVNGLIGDAVAAVDATMLRQKRLRNTAPERSLSSVLGKVDQALTRFTRILDLLEKAKIGGGKPGEVLGAVGGILASPNNDDNSKEARSLLVAAAKDVAAVEKARLREQERHLLVLREIEMELDARQSFLAVTVLPAIGAHLSASKTKGFVQQHGTELIAGVLPDPAPWNAKSLGEYVQGRISDTSRTKAESAVSMAQALAVLLYDNEARLLASRRAVSAELHRHSIRLSRINAGQRLDLVHELSSGLAIYHAGGLKPEELAALILQALEIAATVEAGD